MQFSIDSKLEQHTTTLNIDLHKISIIFLVFASISFFIHLMLYNYNKLKENIIEHINYTSNFIYNENQPSINALFTTQHIIVPLVQNITLPKTEKYLNLTKIGNVTVISVKSGDTLNDILEASGFNKMQSTYISIAVNKKYKLTQLKSGDILQVIKLSRDGAKLDNLKIVINKKIEILVIGVAKKYDVITNRLDGIIRNKLELKKQSIVANRAIQKIKLTGIQINKVLQQQILPSAIKREMINMIYLIKQDSEFKAGNINAEIVYDKVPSQTNGLLYVDLQSAKAKIRVYKYKNSGIVQYIKQNGAILTSQNNKKTSAINNAFKMSYPVHNPVLGSNFGMRHHPILKRHRMHNGLDFRALKGTPIYAPADGIITDIRNSRGFGKHLKIRHNSTYTTLYGHLDNFAHNKTIGKKILKGEVIGYVGKSGLASGEHLHFELHENGRPINPMKLISNNAQSTPINISSVKYLSKKQMGLFKVYQAAIDKRLKAF